MPLADAHRWNERYRAGERGSFYEPRPFLLENAAWLPTSGLALDAAMGLGANAGFLLRRGLRVIGVDIAETAVRLARQQQPLLMAVVGDLADFYLPAETFDVIVNFYYLNRALWPAYLRSLKPGGVLILETLTCAMASLRPDIPEAYLLQPGELGAYFAGKLQMLEYREGWQQPPGRHPRAVASLLGRRKV